MVKLEDIKKDALTRGIEPEEIVRIVSVERVGEHAVTVIYKTNQGRLGEQMLFRTDEARLELAEAGRPWAFDASAEEFKLGLEALRIQLAHLFDPMMAVHTSNVEPLPHQISAVYEFMLQRQPLRFVLADDPGAGKTIMAGLLIRELLMRADAKRVLIVSPGSLTEQWQDELLEKFGVQFEIFSREKMEQSPSGNYFEDQDLIIARLDQLSRNEAYQQKLQATSWDVIVVDEAHKMSANYFGQKVNKTQRFRLGELLGGLCRHFLLMTATPHNGKEEDFQLFMSLLDGDRFYGKFREGAHKVDISDMMRRMVKEELLKFDGKPLFPERRAYTANYELSWMEADLYNEVTDYVRNEMNRAERLLDGKRKGTVGFALTQLQRRLASSPEAIFKSLQRRRKKLEQRLDEMKLAARGMQPGVAQTIGNYVVTKQLDLPDNLDELEDELSPEEYELYAEQVVDQATAAATIPELEAEILILRDLEQRAMDLVSSGNDRKWEELSGLLQDRPEMFTATGNRRKLIIFTEHRDTLNYLVARIRDILGKAEAVVTIHGGTNRDDRRRVQEEFRYNPEVLVLIATDAAGEGVNLQNANLMVNYDLPWNPNRLEQRFGRIHRIGQTEVCHLWNLVACETREGEVFKKLLEKLEIERAALGGRVFDILGEAFENKSLKDLLIEAIRYGELPETKAKLDQAIEGALDTEHLKAIMRRNALVEQHMGMDELYAVKEEMDKAQARKLQPYFIRAFFSEAFRHLGGEMKQREEGRYEIRHVPADLRERDRLIGETRTPVLRKYERICFEKHLIRQDGKPMADLIHPGHPLMRASTDMILGAFRAKLKQGAILVDPNDDGIEPRVLFLLDHSLREGMGEKQKTVSRRLQFVAIDSKGEAVNAGCAPHLDMQALDPTDHYLVQDILNASWITQDLEALALNHASQHLVPSHYAEVKGRLVQQADKIHAAVRERLIKEIDFWSDRYFKLSDEVQAGKQPRMQPENARRTAEELTARLQQREKELEAMRSVVSSTPVVIGGALVIPRGLLAQRKGETTFCADAAARARIERLAMQAVIAAEEALGHSIRDVSADKCGWDITSQPPRQEHFLPNARHIEVKGRAKGQGTITVTRNEIIYGLNQADKFILAIVLVGEDDSFEGPYYVRNPFSQEPDWAETSKNLDLNLLLARALSPAESL
ncbi:RNA helicase [Stutzerimonas balearica]|jgi:superfamily II DNA or RNA helicase|uniref:helicase-related protein n=1 Tax=Stutzerimonas stutzeri group TaxID=136846 RepID=UPI0009702461|nr:MULTISPECIES: helicase-related protein [Stutzerimonas stutzeri group]OMG61446.1 RNA helicase [Stutzerimonas balearica]WIX00992.1 helicase-related protein [Pseudomonas sp. AR5]WRW29076.1 helicase-related protein [Stutzerimonas frequens]